jgi:hypothetical protein
VQYEIGICLLPLGSENIFTHFLLENVDVKIFKSTISLLNVYGCETWSIILKEKTRIEHDEKSIWNNPALSVKRHWRMLHAESSPANTSFNREIDRGK